MVGLSFYDNAPVHGCRGCETTGGRMGCAAHAGVFYSPASHTWVSSVRVNAAPGVVVRLFGERPVVDGANAHSN